MRWRKEVNGELGDGEKLITGIRRWREVNGRIKRRRKDVKGD
jgi:hypothetical protein